MKRLQFRREVSRKKTEGGQQRTKAERGLANPPHKKIKYSNITITPLVEGAEATGRRARGGGCEERSTVFVLSSQTVGTTWNTICVFFLLAKLGKQQREQIPLQKKAATVRYLC